MRSCGECNLCCIVLDVPELNKVRGIQCPHSVKGVGCQIYDTRPQACVDFQCAWLQGDMEMDMMPHKQHVMIEKLPDVPVVLAMIEPNYHNVLRTLKEKLDPTYGSNGIAVVASNGMAVIPQNMSSADIVAHVQAAATEMGFM